MSLELHPHPEGTGADATGVDLTQPPDEALVQELTTALARHGVLRFRNQPINEDQQVAFVERFGTAVGHPAAYVGGKRPDDAVRDDVFYLTHGLDEEQSEEDRQAAAGELFWHTDLQYMEEPQVYSLLHAVEVPPEGGDTQFCDMTRAYATLDEELKAHIAPLKAVHWYVRKIPPVVHPVVRTHPVTREKALFVSPGLTRLIEGWDEAEGKALLQRLHDHSTQDRFVWTQKWSAGDTIMWDNRCTMHKRLTLDPNARRIVRRSQTGGEPVVS